MCRSENWLSCCRSALIPFDGPTGKEIFPAIRVKTALRFDLEEVHRVMQRQAEAYMSARRCAASGARRPPIEAQPSHSQTGALFPDNES